LPTDNIFPWTPEQELCCELNVAPFISKNICRLLEEGNSIPFIARYRKEQTGGMEPDTLRSFKESFESLKSVQEKCTKMIATVEKTGKLTKAVRNSFLLARSPADLDAAYAPFKTGSKTSLAERARALGLGDLAADLLDGVIAHVDPNFPLIEDKETAKSSKGKDKLEVMEAGLQHIMADIIVHHKDISDQVRSLQRQAKIVVESKQNTAKTKDKKPPTKSAKPTKEEDPRKFENYFDFSCPVNYIKSHQVLAINRGENLKILSVKINLPEDWILGQVQWSVRSRWANRGKQSPQRTKLIDSAVKDAFKRLIAPQMIRTCRSELTKMAENSAIASFAENLRKLLLTPPFRGKKILSLDPGFSHGCKVAVVSETGDVIETAVIYPRFQNPNSDEPAIRKLSELVVDHHVDTIAIGNGTGCRETQSLVSHAIETRRFGELVVRYTIVEERGASIYSCSPLAKKEFPDMDTNIISAVSLGRRVQDPLSEYVKIEPHHLGCGMYQHDIAQTKLNSTLDEIVVECVSFVGVNINSCSEHLLKRVAGLSAGRAKAIVDFRQKNGDFLCRDSVKKVKGIGEKVYEQCAGFIRILKSTQESPEKSAKSGKAKKSGTVINPLDATSIHPESYRAATKLIGTAGLNLKDIGSQQFIIALTRFLEKQNFQELVSSLNVGPPTLELIISCLKQNLEYDFRQEFDAPIFRNGMTKLEDIAPGTVLTGRATNVTDFGAFIDIGVGKDGLLHVSKMKGRKVELGNRVEVKLLSKDVQRGKISLELVRML